MLRAVAATLALFGAGAATQRIVHLQIATASIAARHWPYLPGSRMPLRVAGIPPPYGIALLGPGRILPPDTYEVPLGTAPGSALLIAGNTTGLGALRLSIGAPPDPKRPLLLVASYDDGLIVHDARDLSVEGILSTGGAPSDVAVDRSGRAVVTDTQGDETTEIALRPWDVTHVAGVATGDEAAVDSEARAIFVTDRDVDGAGALTRIGFDGSVTRVTTGDTAEGLALDSRRQIVYVANVNDGTVAVVDARTMRVRQRIFAIERVFSLALSADGSRLYAVSNEAADSALQRAGSVVAIALGHRPRIVARSAPLTFPIGIALDAATHRLFVSDEERREIDVLDARTLRAAHAPLPTCAIPWKLTFDASTERLYVPCAGDDAIDAFDVRRLRRIPSAPFPTGGYPLAIAVWPR